MATDLKDDATHEDIEQYVDQVVKDVEEDRKGDDPTDAKKIAEEHDKPVEDTSVEEPSDTAADEGEDTGWIDDDLKAEVAAYGIDEDELSEFTSREEVERALKILDRRAVQKGGEESIEKEYARDDKGQFKKDEASKPDGQFEVNLDKDIYDEGIVDTITGMRDHYETRLGVLEQRFAEVDAQAAETRFDSAVDALGHADLFGKTGSENQKQLARRNELYKVSATQVNGLGLNPSQIDAEHYAILVRRMADGLFADEIGRKKLKAQTRKVSKQSDGRSGGSSMKSPPQEETHLEYARRIYKELEGN